MFRHDTNHLSNTSMFPKVDCNHCFDHYAKCSNGDDVLVASKKQN